MKGYAIKRPDGKIDPDEVSDSEDSAWEKLLFGSRWDKETHIAKGYTCVPVTITEGAAKPVGFLDWPSLQLRVNGVFDRDGVSIRSEPIQLYAHPSAANQRIEDMTRGEYICKRCLLRKDGDTSPADF